MRNPFRSPLSNLRFACTLLAAASCSLMAAPHPAFASAAAFATDLPDLVEKTLPGVVNISSTTVINYQVYGMNDFLQHWGLPQEHKQTSLGSGFLIDRQGFILTNHHVIDQATEVIVTLIDRRQFKAKIIGKDQKSDLALLQIREQIQDKTGGKAGGRSADREAPVRTAPMSKDFAFVPLANSDTVRIAEPVFAVGNPFGLAHTVTTGIVSAKNRTIGIGPFDNFLQTDASINPGNSGGPLFNFKGEVIGINTVIFSKTGQSGGLGFAIPINAAKAVIDNLKRYGRVPRPWLGILSQQMTPQLQAYYNLPIASGVIVINLVQSAPADDAGIRQGDIIVSVDGDTVAEPNDLERSLNRKKANESTKLKIHRGRKVLELNVKLTELPNLDQLPQGII
ncbi:MAG: trypsin-like peptidase domain-containing protein [Methylotenera sp.]|nr:trypsin-like peptidase domain-containing protein [Oligoflexia bacterium]